ncbi:MAG: DUF2293 domain-containing protein [Acidobacteria bacterium]|nr:DUF2293 domain-containing protein [Acidobacteriota bacterium]
MGNKRPGDLKERVEQAADAALQASGSVGPLELLMEMRLLAPSHFTSWRKGIIPALEDVIQGSPEKLRRSFGHFQQWARNRGMRPVKIPYQRNTPGDVVTLRVTLSGDPEREDFFNKRYVPGELSAAKTKQTVAKMSKPQDIVVFETVRQSVICSECETELNKGDFLFMEKDRPLCLNCADLNHLDFLPSGNAALTRRARKYSRLSAVVVRFARARKRYERQGILVEPDAIEKAEQECLGDEDQRMARREREATRRVAQDEKLVDEMAQSIRRIYPGCPSEEAEKIACHTAERGSGRVGRSVPGRNLEERALELAVAAWIRHRWTEYDELLCSGHERLDARELVRHKVREIIGRWKDG